MSFFAELKRRKVYRIAIAYLIASWVALQVADVIVENLEMPGWVFKALLLTIIVGFPVALALAWAFEATSDGIRRDLGDAGNRADVTAKRGSPLLSLGIIAVLLVAVGYLIVERVQEPIAATATSAGQPERSIMVLPFENRSADPNDAFFVAGMHDDILTQLSRLRTLDKVISRTTSVTYEGTGKSTQEIGAELGVANILEGAVQRAGNRIRITMQLIDASTDNHLWAETWDREMSVENLFAIQTEITREIVASLSGALTSEDESQLERLPTKSLEAYEQYVLGRQSLARRTAPSVEAALEHFRRAVTLDPEYALAWVGVADALALLPEYAGRDVADLMPEREAAVARALALNPQSGEAMTALASIAGDKDNEDEEARYFQRAIELSPNYATAHHWYALALREAGDAEAALKHIRRASELDPAAWILVNAEWGILYELGRRSEANALVESAYLQNPEFQPFVAAMADVEARRGNLAQALRFADLAVSRTPRSPASRATQCEALVDLDLLDRAKDCFAAMAADFPGPQGRPLQRFSELYVLQQQGDLSEAIARLVEADALSTWGYGTAAVGAALNGDAAAARRYLAVIAPGFIDNLPDTVTPTNLGPLQVAGIVLSIEGDDDRAARVISMIGEYYQRIGAETLDQITFAAFAREPQRAARILVESGYQPFPDWWILETYVMREILNAPEWDAAYARLRENIAAQRDAYLVNPTPNP